MREGGGGGSFSPTLESERASFAAFLSVGQLVVGRAAGRPVDLSEAEWAHPVCVCLSLSLPQSHAATLRQAPAHDQPQTLCHRWWLEALASLSVCSGPVETPSRVTRQHTRDPL